MSGMIFFISISIVLVHSSVFIKSYWIINGISPWNTFDIIWEMEKGNRLLIYLH